MKAPNPLADDTIRAWWSHRQGLDGSLADHSAAEILASGGWARSVGGAAPYLGLFARAGLSRDQIDADVAALAIHELPSARGCTYVVPAEDFALALTLSQGFGDDAQLATAKKHCGVTDTEMCKLTNGVVTALGDGPLDPTQLKAALGDLVRNLGDEGKKRGVTTTLPLALGLLQSSGEIRRVPINGRLDQQRYRYTRWTPNPLAGSTLTKDEANTELARRFLRWAGPATLDQFRWFAALGLKAAKAALEPLEVATVPSPDEDRPERLLLTEDLDELGSFRPPPEPQYALVAGIDAIVLLRRDVAGILDPRDADHQVFEGRGSRNIGALLDLPNHAVLDRGRLIGLWDYDVETETIAWFTFIEPTTALREAVARTEAFVRDQLGDARSFSLDSVKSRAPRIEALRAAAAAAQH